MTTLNPPGAENLAPKVAAGVIRRAYSTFTVKDVSQKDRILTGMATTPTPDRMGDIVLPEGAKFSLPIPLLWQHDACQPVGQVTQAKVTSDGISVTCQMAQIPEPGTLHDRLEEAWQSVQSGLVRGFSIGFNPIKYAFLEDSWGIEFQEWEMLELSVVTIPANADASIATVKRLAMQQSLSRQKRTGPVLLIKPSVEGKSNIPGCRRGPVKLIKS